MGKCMSRNKSKIQVQTGIGMNRNDLYGIQVIQSPEKQLKFNHSPLSACPFLSEKLSNNPNAPEEVNLGFMISNVHIDITENIVNFTVINKNTVNVYLVQGGVEQKSITGLTVSINKIKYCQKVVRRNPSQPNGNSLMIVPKEMNQEPIYLILEPVLKQTQTMFMINKYSYSIKEKVYRLQKQTMQWNSLAFELQDIFGADNLFKCDAGQQCSVCLSSPANVILTPCRHMCLCSICSKSYEKSSRKCPICRTEFRAIIGYN